MMIKRIIILLVTVMFQLFYSQNVTGVYTDYSYTRTVGGISTNYNVWQSSNTAQNAVYPDNSHNLLAFTWSNGITFSTGVNDALLSTVLSPSLYTPSNFQAFPVSSIPSPSSDSYIGVGNRYGGGPGNVTPIPVTNNMSNYIVDGTHGLDLGTAIFNLPSSQQLRYQVVGVNLVSINDDFPDILVTQVGQIPNVSDKFKFIDQNGNTVGQEVPISFSTVSRVGQGSWKFCYDTVSKSLAIYNGTVWNYWK